ncbi:MAG: DNA translocase FtsK 4TM domain-containing protein [Anaerolineae bacterium]|nr:DNA translocase FtsK [Anaerolineae bacterium]MDW8100724.1 DNA translocase FtsK 4TM domain-containing protein [Anaerolineae bacterium]
MASRRQVEASKRRGRSVKAHPGVSWTAIIGFVFRGQTLGVALVAMGILTLISLPGAEEGILTRWWMERLRAAFGLGAYLIPLVFGIAGFWLVMRSVKADSLDGQRLIGLGIAFLIFLALAHAFAGQPDPEIALKGQGGGLVGRLIGQFLIDALGVVFAVALLIVVGVVALILASQHTFTELADAVGEVAQRLLDAWRNRRAGLRATAPLPSGELSWHVRLRNWIRKRTALKPGDALVASGVGRSTIHVAQPSGEAKGQEEAAGPLVGRIIGGEQEWRLPPIAEVLEEFNDVEISREEIRERARIIEQTLASFGVPVQVVEVNQGPAVTQFGVQPGYIIRKGKDGRVEKVRVKVSRIQALVNDLALALAAAPIRIEAPVPGRSIVGIEVPNAQMAMVSLRSILESEEFQRMSGPLRIALGRDVSGQPVVADLSTMPHLLIAGATGSGKSVCINAIIATLLCTHTPDTLRFLMIDPKMVELTGYNGIPHLIAPVVTEVERVVSTLQWATREMERRYKLFSKAGARNIEAYNQTLRAHGEPVLPYIVIVIDELADLMMAAPEEVEQTICRLAQMARATGIHLIIATQRPSVDVVTGLIKANFPARIAFAVVSQVDSRVILDAPGAERLLGRGDMLFMRPDSSKLERLQGAYVSDRELERLVRHWKGMRVLGGPDPAGLSGVRGLATAPPFEPGQAIQRPLWEEMIEQERKAVQRDDLYEEAVKVVREAGRASVSLLQRRLRIGYSRAARLIDLMEEEGVIGPDEGGPHGRRVIGEPPEKNDASVSADR